MAEKIAHTLHPDKLDNLPEWSAVEVTEDIVVEDKYQGNIVDRSEMRMLGRIQVLRVGNLSPQLPIIYYKTDK